MATQSDADFEKLKDKFGTLAVRSTDLVEVGISPHAPYTVSRELFERIASFAVDENQRSRSMQRSRQRKINS